MATKSKSGGRRYGPAAGKSVESALKRRSKGTLKRGKQGHGGTVTSRKQAIAIGLAEAREHGAKVPDEPTGRARGARKGGAKRAATKRSATKRSTAKKGTAKRSTAKKGTAKRSTAKRSTAKRGSTKRSTAKKGGAKRAAAKRSSR